MLIFCMKLPKQWVQRDHIFIRNNNKEEFTKGIKSCCLLIFYHCFDFLFKKKKNGEGKVQTFVEYIKVRHKSGVYQVNAKLVYVADDEIKIRELIKTYLLKEGYEVEIFPDGRSVFDAFVKKPADMLIIDIMMPGLDGYALCREIRRISEVPIIMVSAKDEEFDRVLGLELGSDDYISKPFSPRELVARVKTIFRRIKEDPVVKVEIPDNILKVVDLILIPDERRIIKDKAEIELTTKEYDFIFFLAKNINRVFTREQLINNIWGYEYIGDTRAIDDLVKRVRKKLIDAGSSLEITTVWGYGYKISDK